jgi:hypothetical protein
MFEVFRLLIPDAAEPQPKGLSRLAASYPAVSHQPSARGKIVHIFNSISPIRVLRERLVTDLVDYLS